jgi:hypothetical protein
MDGPKGVSEFIILDQVTNINIPKGAYRNAFPNLEHLVYCLL